MNDNHPAEQDDAAEQRQAERDLVRAMFGTGRADAADPEPAADRSDPTRSNYVRAEGWNDQRHRPNDYGARDCVGALFERPEYLRGMYSDPGPDYIEVPHRTDYL